MTRRTRRGSPHRGPHRSLPPRACLRRVSPPLYFYSKFQPLFFFFYSLPSSLSPRDSRFLPCPTFPSTHIYFPSTPLPQFGGLGVQVLVSKQTPEQIRFLNLKNWLRVMCQNWSEWGEEDKILSHSSPRMQNMDEFHQLIFWFPFIKRSTFKPASGKRHA